jgi:glycosyltransferase involved in cell wall biosynthesis
MAHKALLKALSNPDHYFQNQGLSPGWSAQRLLAAVGETPQVIVVHYISHFLSASDVQALQQASGAAVVWNLLDMALMTGGCHYAWTCRGYEAQCGNCPSLRLRHAHDTSARVWKRKARAMAGMPGIVVAGSSLLARQARSSSLFRDMPIETVLLGVSPEQLQPLDRQAQRTSFGITGPGKLIFFGAQRFNQRRKGMDKLMEALASLRAQWPASVPLPSILSAGDATDFQPIAELGFEHRSLGFVNAKTLARAYAAADVFACPSVEDSGPMMINEALMCGTPVVAFDMGVARDLILPGETGQIAPLADAAAFARGLAQVLGQDEAAAQATGRRCREVALARCTPELQVLRFTEICERLMPLSRT